jgi:hypothetical protein
MSVRAHNRRVKRRLADEFALGSAKKDETGVENLQELFEKISLKDVPLEERRREANKPLYLVRYE